MSIWTGWLIDSTTYELRSALAWLYQDQADCIAALKLLHGGPVTILRFITER